jgi:renalase
MFQRQTRSVAIIGAGLAGATCARQLAQAGWYVHLFDKSRGPGGRMATRRLVWTDDSGRHHTTAFDHGAVGLGAHHPGFLHFLQQACRAGHVLAWEPQRKGETRAGSGPIVATGTGTAAAGEGDAGDALSGAPAQPDFKPALGEARPQWIPAPDGPALCRHLVAGLATTYEFTVTGLHRSMTGWRLQSGERLYPASFGAVLLALPPAQAAPLLMPHQSDWARRAALVAMQPCWTLMGVADDTRHSAAGRIDPVFLRPAQGPLALLMRNDRRPGRTTVCGQSHWVAHAQAGWSRRQLEAPASAVQTQLQAAVAEALGHPVRWLHSTVHRWRYALPPAHAQQPQPAAACWWQTPLQLGVCGDFLGGHGLEGAWLSAHALSAALVGSAGSTAPSTSPVGAQPVPTRTDLATEPSCAQP